MAFLKLRDWVISMDMFTNSDDLRVCLKSIKPVFDYRDGKKTDKIIGHAYINRLPHNENKYISIKIMDGETPLISPMELVEKGEMLVTYEDIETKFYTNSKGYPDYSITAKRIKEENV